MAIKLRDQVSTEAKRRPENHVHIPTAQITVYVKVKWRTQEPAIRIGKQWLLRFDTILVPCCVPY